MTTYILEKPSAFATFVEVEADSFYIDDGTLVFINEGGIPVSAYAAGKWETVIAKPAPVPEPLSEWHYLTDVDTDVYVVVDKNGDQWSSYDGQLRWLRDKDLVDARSVEYTGPFTRP